MHDHQEGAILPVLWDSGMSFPNIGGLKRWDEVGGVKEVNPNMGVSQN